MPHTHCLPLDTTSSSSVHIPVDSIGGGELSEYGGTSAVVVTPYLRCLDISDCEKLEHLDLTECQPECHVTIRACHALCEIRVRSGGRGAVIHIDSGDQPPSLHIKGAVDQVDGCWSKGQFYVSSAESPWNNAIVCPYISAIPDSHSANAAECWVLLAPQITHAVIDAPELRHCYVSGGNHLEALSIIALSDKTPQIELYALPELLSVDVHAWNACCRARDCCSLTALSGELADLHLSKVSHHVHALSIEVEGERIALSHSSLNELALSKPVYLSLVHCTSLEMVSLPPMTSIDCVGPVPSPLVGIATVVVDESSVKSLVAAFPRDPEGTMQQLPTLIPSMAPPASCVKALQLLHELSELGAQPEQIWDLRLSLSARHLSMHRKKQRAESQQRTNASNRWKWCLPDDLAREGWMADYRIWVECAKTVPDAFHYRRALVRAAIQVPDGLAMQTIVQAMSLHSEGTLRHELDLWRDIMEAMADKEPIGIVCWVKHARTLALRYGKDERLDRAYLEASETLLPLGELLDLLQRLGVHRPEVRTCLLRVAHRPRHWREKRSESPKEAEQLRATAMTLAISRTT
ncbi:hypothetical protein [Halomonas sp. SL1]|uniref:hypothetical protein n=1 Tax=Halomonas sp. SL1 TaxID=2137478 RepID=UPI0011B9415B|nr:hypothetical protein [Halomonas sp. SL1]